jgi:hypothetical protein
MYSCSSAVGHHAIRGHDKGRAEDSPEGVRQNTAFASRMVPHPRDRCMVLDSSCQGAARRPPDWPDVVGWPEGYGRHARSIDGCRPRLVRKKGRTRSRVEPRDSGSRECIKTARSAVVARGPSCSVGLTRTPSAGSLQARVRVVLCTRDDRTERTTQLDFFAMKETSPFACSAFTNALASASVPS